MSHRKFALYFSWNRTSEIGAELGVLENRYPTLFEFRRAIWPLYEWARDTAVYRQDISGFLDRVVLFDFQHFMDVVSQATGNPVSLIQRGEDRIQKLDADLLENIDTLIVISLDHFQTEERADSEEITAIRQFLAREDACLVVCPQHDVGAGGDRPSQEVEFLHHGDRLVPAQQRIGGFARSLLAGLGYPIENLYGLSPAASPIDNSPAPLQIFPELDELNILQGVTTFNLHPHLPHFSITKTRQSEVRVLAKQLINPNAASHPFVEAGNTYFNAFVWIPPKDSQAGNLFVCDATLWSSAFGGVASLEVFWKNLARMKVNH